MYTPSDDKFYKELKENIIPNATNIHMDSKECQAEKCETCIYEYPSVMCVNCGTKCYNYTKQDQLKFW